MEKMAIIDMGSNSIKLLLVEIKGKDFTVIDEIKELARLGENMGEENTLKKEQLNKAFEALKLFKLICDSKNITNIMITATEAVRKATNGGDFIKKVKTELKMDIQILSGEKEAYYDYVAVTNSLGIRDALIMDVGGCSTEIIWNKNKKIKMSISLPIGALNITEKFDLYNGITDEKQGELKKYLYGIFSSVDWLFKINYEVLIGLGGTFRNIGSVDASRKDIKLPSLNDYRFRNNDIKSIYYQIKNKTVFEKKEIKGISLDRADIFTGGLFLINAFTDFCGIQDIILSAYGIREGLVYDYINKELLKNTRQI